jgi:polysaccharide pyruvyl transferase WcaK-like protein
MFMVSQLQRIRVAVFNDTRPTRHFGCELVMQELIAGLTRHGMEPVWFHPVGVDWRDSIGDIPKRAQIDAIIVNGEGSIHHSAMRPRAVFLTEIAAFARQQVKVPAFLINATINEIDSRTADNLKLFDRIYVREGGSRRVLEQYGICSTVVPDLTLQAPFRVSPVRRGVCGTDSVLMDVSRSIGSFCTLNGWQFRSMKRGDFNRELKEAGDFGAWLSSHEFVITGRFHAVTFCIATKTPFVAIDSNTPKISSFVNDIFGEIERVIPLAGLAQLDTERFRNWTSTEVIAVDTGVQRARMQTEEMFKELRSHLTG